MKAIIRKIFLFILTLVPFALTAQQHGNYDYDYFYSSRIKRFHSSYTSFSYYAPVYSETYWYSYQPKTWGLSIYDRPGYGAGIVYSAWQPSWNYSNYGWEQAYFSNSYYWGYTPVYYNYWYSPVIVRLGNSRPVHAYNYPDYGRPHNHFNDNGYPVKSSYNNHPSDKSDSKNVNSSVREQTSSGNNSGNSGDTRRYSDPKNRRSSTIDNSNDSNNSNNSNNNNNSNSSSSISSIGHHYLVTPNFRLVSIWPPLGLSVPVYRV